MRGNWRSLLAQQGRAFGRGGAGLALAAVLFSGWGTPVTAQGDPKFRKTALGKNEEKQWLDDLSARDFGSTRNKPRRPHANQDLDAPTTEMKKLRPLIEEFSNQMSLLNSQLTDELSQTPSLRGLLSDALNLTADAVMLAKRARTERDQEVLFDDLQRIDAAWGELSYRLGTQRRLSQEAKDYIASLNEIAEDVRGSLSIGQQVNYRDLSTKTITLATDLENLIEDIRSELRPTQEGKQLITATSKVHQQVLALAELSDERAELDSIAQEYRRFRELWYPQAAKLQAQKQDYFSQSLRRIARTDGELARLLLLQDRFDKTQVVYLTSALRKDITKFFYYATLDQLLKLPRANQTVATAEEFYGVCDNFVDTVNGNASYEEIVDAFRHIEQADRSFLAVFGTIENDDAASALENISQTLNALRTSLQVDHEDFNRQAAGSLVAKIENLADNIDKTARRWLAHDRQSFAQNCLDETDQLAQAAATLHDEIVNGANVQQIRRDTEALYQNWRRVYNYLVKCQTDERQALGRFSSQLTPAMVQLRTLVAQ